MTLQRLTFAVPLLAAGISLLARAAPATFIDHGTAAAVSEARGLTVTPSPDGAPLILALPMDRYSGGLRTSILVVDARTGRATQHWHPRREAANEPPYHLLLASSGRLYVMFGPSFLEFDITGREFTFTGNAGSAGTAMSMAEAPDGTIYAATYPSAHLLAFDPQARTLKELGRLDEKEQYPSSLLATADGWVYAGIGTARRNLVAFNPSTRTRRQLMPEDQRAIGTVKVQLGADGIAYARPDADGPWLRLRDGAATPSTDAPGIVPAAGQGWGEKRLSFPGGQIRDFSLSDRRFQYVEADRPPRAIHFDYESAGAAIASLAAGPDGNVYASTSHPMHLAAIDPASGKLSDLGHIPSIGGGNFPAMTAWNGRLLGMAYSSGVLFDYDPAKPFNGSTGDAPNPRNIGSFPHASRPRGAMTHSDGRHVIFGGFPGYGHVGGGLLIRDMIAGIDAGLTARDLLPGHSPIAIDELPGGDLVFGTSINTPGGGHADANAARIAFLDFKTRKLRSSLPMEGAREVVSVCALSGGGVIALTRESRLIFVDAAQHGIFKQIDVSNLGAPAGSASRSLLRTEDGRILLLLSKSISLINPADLSTKPIGHPPAPLSAAGAIADGRVFFGSDSNIWSCPIPAAGDLE